MSQFYFDHNASTPLHPEVAEAIGMHLKTFGNPSSIHFAGRDARSQVEDAREALAKLLAVHPTEIAFTSGGTEANNLAILGAVASGKLRGRHLITSAFEHPAVLEPFRKLESEGYAVTWINPDGDGVITLEAVEKALRPDTGLVSIMAANNEVGTIQPIAEIGKLLRSRGIIFHSDAVQALGKVADLHPGAWQADFVSFSAHKINGPKGVGALYIRKGAPLQGLLLGGPHERNFRAGTENVLGIVAFGKAAEIALRDGASERNRLQILRDGLESALRTKFPDLIVNGRAVKRLPNTLNITLPGCRSDMLVMGLDMRGLAISGGSACASGSVKYSHVILAMGKGQEAAASSLRISLGLGNREEDIAHLVEQLGLVAASVRG
jgi:cysteine desulfurase